MAFPIQMTAKMSGATVAQLAYWRQQGILRPEVEALRRPYLYSYRDVVALRTFAWLRGQFPLSSVRKMLASLREYDMHDHPASYQLFKAGKTVGVIPPGSDTILDLVQHPGAQMLGTFADVFAEFRTSKDRVVDPFLQPRAGLMVDPARLGGWPTINGTRVPFDVVAELVEGGVPAEEVGDYYVGVSPDQARDAVDYHESLAAA